MIRLMRDIFCLLVMLGVGCLLRAEATVEASLQAQEEEEFDIDVLTPNEILVRARSMFPQEQFRVEGLLSVERTRGVRESGFLYTLNLDWAGMVPQASIVLYTDDWKREEVLKAEMTGAFSDERRLTFVNADGSRLEAKSLNTPVGESDLTWMDLTFDYLWWPNVKRLSDEECERRSIKSRQIGRNCVVLEVYPPAKTAGLGSILLWADRATGFVIQTQYLNEAGGSVRRLWVQRLGRENGRWVPRLFSVQRSGERRPRKTHLRIYTIRSASFSVDRLEDE